MNSNPMSTNKAHAPRAAGVGSFSHIFNILQSAQDVLYTDEEEKILDDLLSLEPTPIGPNGIHRIIQESAMRQSYFSHDDAVAAVRTSSSCRVHVLNVQALKPDSELSAPFSTEDWHHEAPEPTLSSFKYHEEDSHAVVSLDTLPPMKRQRVDSLNSSSSLFSDSFFPNDSKSEDSFDHFVQYQLQEQNVFNIVHEEGRGPHRFRQYQAEQWNERFQDLIDFKQQYGHALVPHNFPSNQQLAQWTKRQRYQYKLKRMGCRSTLTDDRQIALEEIGFVWDSHNAAWWEQLESLKEFHKAHGHSSVPSNFKLDHSLAVWVKRQRQQYRLYMKGAKSAMNKERYNALEQLGFDWNPKKLAV